jgi:hypothetical protein
MEGGGKRIKRAPSAILRLIRESKDLAVWLLTTKVDPTNCLEEIATWKYGTAVFLMDARLSEEQRHALLTKHTEHEKKVARLRQLYHTDPVKFVREF